MGWKFSGTANAQDKFVHFFAVWARFFDSVFGFGESSSGNQFHRPGDGLGVFCRTDALSNLLERCHSRCLLLVEVVLGFVFGEGFFVGLLDGFLGIVTECSAGSDAFDDIRVFLVDEGDEELLELLDVVVGDIVHGSAGAGEDGNDLLFDRVGNDEVLLEEFGESLTAKELHLGCSVEVGGELGEGLDFAVVCHFELHFPGDGLHSFDLGVSTDAADGDSDVDCWADTSEEEVWFEIDLSVGD